MNSFPATRWYAEGLRFECQRCGACCTGEPGYVWVTHVEGETIAEFLGISMEQFATRYLRKAGSDDSLIGLPDGRCIFCADKNCTVYPVRPLQCRTFPFWRSIIASREDWRRCEERCPGIGSGRLYSVVEIEHILRSGTGGYRGPGFYPR